MVKFWDNELQKSIKKTKIRVQFCEKHGIGDTTIHEKSNLKKAERKLQLRRNPQ